MMTAFRKSNVSSGSHVAGIAFVSIRSVFSCATVCWAVCAACFFDFFLRGCSVPRVVGRASAVCIVCLCCCRWASIFRLLVRMAFRMLPASRKAKIRVPITMFAISLYVFALVVFPASDPRLLAESECRFRIRDKQNHCFMAFSCLGMTQAGLGPRFENSFLFSGGASLRRSSSDRDPQARLRKRAFHGVFCIGLSFDKL